MPSSLSFVLSSSSIDLPVTPDIRKLGNLQIMEPSWSTRVFIDEEGFTVAV